nr:hypothetical protein [Tanacetum cinerariifolium]
MSLMIMKNSISVAIQGAISDSENAKEFLKSVEEQFKGSSIANASTLILKMFTTKYDGLSGVREHIIMMNDMASKLNGMDMAISKDSGSMVHITNSLQGFFLKRKLQKGERTIRVGDGAIHHALTVSLTIYTSYIEQFWNTASSQTINDEKEIHATIDSKAVVVTEASIRSSLLFNDVGGTACLTNEAIFQNLTLMGYEGELNKLTFQKALFSPQLKYLIHTILHCLSSKSTSWNEFLTNIASAVICLETNQKFNFSKLIFDGMLRNFDNPKKKFLMSPRYLMVCLNNQIELGEPFNDVYTAPAHNLKVFSNMSRKRLKFSEKITPLFPNMLIQVEGEECVEVIYKEEVWTEGVYIQTREKKNKKDKHEPTLDDSAFDADLDDKDKGVLEEPDPTKKMTRSDLDAAQIVKDAELTRLVYEEELAELEREKEKRQKEEEASKAVIAEMYDEVQARIEADALFAAKL